MKTNAAVSTWLKRGKLTFDDLQVLEKQIVSNDALTVIR